MANPLYIDAVPDPKPGSRGYFVWYWCYGPGLRKWITSPHPYTALEHHLRKYIPLHSHAAAARWFHLVLGYYPGHPHVGIVPL